MKMKIGLALSIEDPGPLFSQAGEIPNCDEKTGKLIA